jgi:hypothetical protein
MITIPKKLQPVIREGDHGIGVFAVQRVCNRFKITCAEDLDFGPATTKAVRQLQARFKLTADGVVGPHTQAALATRLCNQHEDAHGLPKDLLASLIAYESGGMLTAVNWSVPGGVDCGIIQRRVYQDTYHDDAIVKRAFDAPYQVNLTGGSISDLFLIFLARPGVKKSRELAWRLAVLNHNYPLLADKISRVGVKNLTSYYTTPQSWVLSFEIKFPDGTPVSSPLDWGARYALGNSAHREPGQAVRSVSW